MPDNNTPQGGALDSFEPITSQEEFDKRIQARLARQAQKFADYDDLKEKAKQYDELVEQGKTDLEKAVARAEKAEVELRKLQEEKTHRDLVAQVARDTKVKPEYVAMLSGRTLEELTEQAKALAPEFSEPVRSDNGKNDSKGGGYSTGLEAVNALLGI